MPIVNNYGVWMDEFGELGLNHTLECSWPDTLCYFGPKEVSVVRASNDRVGRSGRCHPQKLRSSL